MMSASSSNAEDYHRANARAIRQRLPLVPGKGETVMASAPVGALVQRRPPVVVVPAGLAAGRGIRSSVAAALCRRCPLRSDAVAAQLAGRNHAADGARVDVEERGGDVDGCEP